MTHNPLPTAENKSLNNSAVNEKESLDEVLNELETLIGLDIVKREVKSLINYIKIQKEREKVGLKGVFRNKGVAWRMRGKKRKSLGLKVGPTTFK